MITYGWLMSPLQTVQIKLAKYFFYIPSTRAHGIRNSGSGQVYVKEIHRLETVHWQSIIEIQTGTWLPNNTFRIAQ